MGQGFKLYYYKTSTMQLPQGYIDLERVCNIEYFIVFHNILNRLLSKSYDRNKHPKRPFSPGKFTNFTRKSFNFGTFLKLNIS